MSVFDLVEDVITFNFFVNEIKQLGSVMQIDTLHCSIIREQGYCPMKVLYKTLTGFL